MWRADKWPRQRHSVHTASGQAGQVNQASSRTISQAPANDHAPAPTRQPQAPSAKATPPASNALATILGTKRRAGS